MKPRNGVACALAEIAFEILNKLAMREDVPPIGDVRLNLMDSKLDIQAYGSSKLDHIARWAELFEADVVIEEKLTYFGVDVVCDQYDYPVHVWTHLSFHEAVRLYAELQLDGEQKRQVLTAGQLRRWATPEPRAAVSQAVLDEIAAPAPATDEPCTYTFAHTRHFCGRVTCRES